MSSSDEPPTNLDDPQADIILRSCDHYEFRVMKLSVTKVSPVLCEFIQSSSSHVANATSSLPSVQLSDSGATLFSLLTFILPMLPVLPSTLEHTMTLLSAAQKYQMDAILSRIRNMVASKHPPFICPETAFQAYSLARTHGLRQEALQAARITLTFPFTIEGLEDELDVIPGIHLHELWKYYQSVRTHLTSDLASFRSIGMPMLTSPACFTTGHGNPVWLDDYVGSITESPALFDLTEFHLCLLRHVHQMGCSCGNMPSKTVRTFWTELTNVVHSCMTNVSLDGLRGCAMLANNLNFSIGRVSFLAFGRSSNYRESWLSKERLIGCTT
jgi:hypothetical protein